MNSVQGNPSEITLLVAVVELGAWYLDPSCVRGRDTENVDAYGAKNVDIGLGVEWSIPLLENWTALGAKALTEGPFIGGVGVQRILPDGVDVGFIFKPASNVGAVAFEFGPVQVDARCVTGRVSDGVLVTCRTRVCGGSCDELCPGDGRLDEIGPIGLLYELITYFLSEIGLKAYTVSNVLLSSLTSVPVD